MKYQKFYILLLWISVFLLSSPVVLAQETPPVENASEPLLIETSTPTPVPVSISVEPSPTSADSPTPTPSLSPTIIPTATISPLPSPSPDPEVEATPAPENISPTPVDENITPTEDDIDPVQITPTPILISKVSSSAIPSAVPTLAPSAPVALEQKNNKGSSKGTSGEPKKTVTPIVSPKPDPTPKAPKPQGIAVIIEKTFQSYLPSNISKLLNPVNLYAGTTLSSQAKRNLLSLSIVFMFTGLALIDKSKIEIFKIFTRREPFYLNKYPVILIRRSS